MSGSCSISSQHNILVGAFCSDVYVFGYDEEGKEEVYEYLESVAQDNSGPNFAVKLVEGSIKRSKISTEFSTAIKNIRTNMKTEDTSGVFVMVMNPNKHSKTNEEKAVVTQLLRLIGSEISNRCVLVLIEGNALLKKETDLENHYKKVVGRQRCMCDLYKQLYPRIIAIDISENPPFVKSRENDQIFSLLLAASSRFDKPVSNWWIIVTIIVSFFLGILFTVFVSVMTYFLDV